MIAKEKVLKTLKEMPDQFSAEELIRRIILIDKVEKGLEDIDEGRSITLKEAEEEYKKKWKK